MEAVSLTTLQSSPFSLNQTGDAPGSPSDDWQQLADATDIDEEGLREVYVAALEECKYDSAELEAVHTLAEKAQQTLNPRFVVITADSVSMYDPLSVHSSPCPSIPRQTACLPPPLPHFPLYLLYLLSFPLHSIPLSLSSFLTFLGPLR